MTLEALNPGVTVEQVVENTGFELIIRGEVPTLDPPTAQELGLLREAIDPQRFYI
jgi:glutaconate CoA-transferase subunit B